MGVADPRLPFYHANLAMRYLFIGNDLANNEECWYYLLRIATNTVKIVNHLLGIHFVAVKNTLGTYLLSNPTN